MATMIPQQMAEMKLQINQIRENLELAKDTAEYKITTLEIENKKLKDQFLDLGKTSFKVGADSQQKTIKDLKEKVKILIEMGEYFMTFYVDGKLVDKNGEIINESPAIVAKRYLTAAGIIK